VIVDPSDYAKYFQSQSPLNVGSLQSAVCAVLAHKPRVLVVDFDTSDPSFRSLTIPETGSHIIWARTVFSFRGETKIGDVLGSASTTMGQGFAVASRDPDGTVRSIPREIRLDGKWFNTLHWGAVSDYRAALNGGHIPEFGSISRQTRSLDATHLAADFQFRTYRLREFSPAPRSCETLSPEALPDLSSDVVILGGQYDFADIHATPFGGKWGVELLGIAIQSELSNEGMRHFPKLWKYFLKVVLGFVIGWLFTRLYATAATLVVLLALIPMVLFGNLIAVLVLGYEGMVVPFTLGILIEQLVTATEKAQHEQKKVETGLLH